jgi:hypothetical protein
VVAIVLAGSRIVRIVPTYFSLNNLFEHKLLNGHNAIKDFQLFHYHNTPMSQRIVSLSPPFPHHQYDFGDSVVITPTCESGFISGIVHRDNMWYYHIPGLRCAVQWWTETQVTAACPNCLKQWQGTATCFQCGFDPDH